MHTYCMRSNICAVCMTPRHAILFSQVFPCQSAQLNLLETQLVELWVELLKKDFGLIPLKSCLFWRKMFTAEMIFMKTGHFLLFVCNLETWFEKHFFGICLLWKSTNILLYFYSIMLTYINISFYSQHKNIKKNYIKF
jgi:hypothetical protein